MFTRNRKPVLREPMAPAGCYGPLVEFLMSHISVAEQAQNLVKGAELFCRLPEREQQEQIIPMYLAAEHHLVELDPNKKFLREQLREIVKTRYPELLSRNEGLALVFSRAEEQEILLCREFLRRVLALAASTLPDRKYPIATIMQWLATVPSRAVLPFPFGVGGEAPTDHQGWLSLLRKLAIEVYRNVGDWTSENRASGFYETVYGQMLELYVLLETFPAIMFMLPEGLMDREKQALLRLGNIRRLLSEKSEQLHEITEQLLRKNNELAEIRTELHRAKLQLEERVRERTAELEVANRQLREEIHERRNTETALRASQEYARNIIDSSLDMIVAVDKDRAITEFNRSAQTTFGYTREDVLGKHVSLLYANADETARISNLISKTQDGCVIEVLNKKKNGEVFPSILSASTLRDAAGTVIGYMGVSRDISKEKEGEESLRRSEERYRTLFEESKDAVFICSKEGYFTEINPAGVELFGCVSKEELVGNSARNPLFANEEGYRTFLSTLLERKFVRDYELEFTRGDGAAVTVTITANAVVNEHGVVECIRGIMRDVTERKKLEAQLLQSQKLESIGLLAGGIAHDINNVLTPVLMALDFFREELKKKESIELLEMVEATAKRGADIVKQILMIARRVEGELIELDVRHLVKEMMKVIVETFPKTIRMRTEIPKTLWCVRGDSSQLHQILLNLTVNARDAMPDGGVLTLSLENVELDEQYAKMRIDASAGPYVVLSVSDTGVGIPKKHLEKIFEPFFTTKDPGKGTGLGLSTVHSIVKNHKGFIEVWSEEGQGTTFKIYLPAVVAVQREELPAPDKDIPGGQGERILVVDDEESVREATVRTLRKHGYEAAGACDGTQAVALYAQRRGGFDLVITDLSMPVMDGYATIRALERIDNQVCIIASSGRSTGEATPVFPTSARVLSVLQKPYTAERLLLTVHDVLIRAGKVPKTRVKHKALKQRTASAEGVDGGLPRTQ